MKKKYYQAFQSITKIKKEVEGKGCVNQKVQCRRSRKYFIDLNNFQPVCQLCEAKHKGNCVDLQKLFVLDIESQFQQIRQQFQIPFVNQINELIKELSNFQQTIKILSQKITKQHEEQLYQLLIQQHDAKNLINLLNSQNYQSDLKFELKQFYEQSLESIKFTSIKASLEQRLSSMDSKFMRTSCMQRLAFQSFRNKLEPNSEYQAQTFQKYEQQKDQQMVSKLKVVAQKDSPPNKAVKIGSRRRKLSADQQQIQQRIKSRPYSRQRKKQQKKQKEVKKEQSPKVIQSKIPKPFNVQLETIQLLSDSKLHQRILPQNLNILDSDIELSLKDPEQQFINKLKLKKI